MVGRVLTGGAESGALLTGDNNGAAAAYRSQHERGTPSSSTEHRLMAGGGQALPLPHEYDDEDDDHNEVRTFALSCECCFCPNACESFAPVFLSQIA